MNDIILEKIDDLSKRVEVMIGKISQVNDMENRLLSFKVTAGRLGDDVRELRKETDERLRNLERGSWFLGVLLCVFWLSIGVAFTFLLTGCQLIPNSSVTVEPWSARDFGAETKEETRRASEALNACWAKALNESADTRWSREQYFLDCMEARGYIVSIFTRPLK